MNKLTSTPVYLRVIFATVIVLSLIVYRAEAAEIAIIDIQSQALNLDDGVVSDGAGDPMAESTGADVLFAHHANRMPHAVVFPAEQGVEIAFLDNISYDGVSAADMEGLSFSVEPLDLAWESGDTVVVRTDTGAVYKLGNAVESATAVTINYEQIL